MKHRLNLDLTETAKKNLDGLLNKTECTTYSELVRRSLGLLDMVNDNLKKGGKLVLRKEDGSEEIVNFSL